MHYKGRIADQLLEQKLQAKGAILIVGPKWCGKTTTALQHANSLLDLGDSSVLAAAEEEMQFRPKKLLEGAVPRLIDEWQSIPMLWDMVRSEVDKREPFGQFILTGSSVPIEVDQLRRSGTGRIGRLLMRTMSLWESGESTGSISLEAIFNGEIIEPQENILTLEDIAFLLCRGGWPRATLLKDKLALMEARDYFEAIYTTDIHRVDKVRRNSERTRLLLRSYARNQGSSISYVKMKDDIQQNDNHFISDETIADYIDALNKLFVIEDMPAWNPNICSKTAIQSSTTRYFIDPSIATSALSVGPQDLLNDLRSFGFFFESMAVRDLRTYADALDGTLYHYRDSTGLECDAVLHRRDGTYGLIEIKLGGTQHIEKGIETLKALAAKIDTSKMRAPSFLMVVTAVGNTAGIRQSDGVYVVPIGCLRP